MRSQRGALDLRPLRPRSAIAPRFGHACQTWQRWALRAFREGKLPFPDGTIIARLAYSQTTSEQSNKAVGRAAVARRLSPEAVQKLLNESSVAGPPTNAQCMVTVGPFADRSNAAPGLSFIVNDGTFTEARGHSVNVLEVHRGDVGSDWSRKSCSHHGDSPRWLATIRRIGLR